MVKEVHVIRGTSGIVFLENLGFCESREDWMIQTELVLEELETWQVITMETWIKYLITGIIIVYGELRIKKYVSQH